MSGLLRSRYTKQRQHNNTSYHRHDYEAQLDGESHQSMLRPHPMTKSFLLLTALFTTAAGAARAQSTDTEREAAAAITKQIDSLEARLRPTETAERLAAKADPARDRVLA